MIINFKNSFLPLNCILLLFLLQLYTGQNSQIRTVNEPTAPTTGKPKNEEDTAILQQQYSVLFDEVPRPPPFKHNYTAARRKSVHSNSSSAAAKTPLPSQKQPQLSAKQRYNQLGSVITTEFPTDEALHVSVDSVVWARQSRMYEHMPCWGDDDSNSPHSKYDVVLLPIGCFGDMPGAHCGSTSCYFGHALANATYCAKRKFGAFLGDNFYPSGLRSSRDPRFDKDLQSKFFRHEALRMRYYAMAGNHDGRPSTLLRDNHPYWYMPQTNYTGDVISVPGGASVQVFVVDTHWGFERNYPHMAEQAKGLELALKASTATWKVVMSHEPVFCFADFIHSKSLIDHIHPLLIKYNVQFFVSAHVHGVYFHPVLGGYHQLVSAGFADNFHERVKPRRPNGYYHLGRGATAVYFNSTFADVVAFMPDASIIFRHRVPVKVDKTAPIAATPIAEGDETLFDIKSHCEAYKPFRDARC